MTTSPVISGWRASTTLKLSLSTTSLPRSSASRSMSGCEADLHLAAAGEDVDGAVVVLADDDAVRRRRLGELVDLVAQRGDVLARLAQGVAQLLVLGDGLGQLALGLEQPLLERAHALRGVGEAGAQVGDLVVEHGRPAARRASAGLVASIRSRWPPVRRADANATRHVRASRRVACCARADASVSTPMHRVNSRA